MERETKTFITPISKQTVVIKTYLTGREKRALTNIFLQGDLNFNAETKNVSGLDFTLVDTQQDLAFNTVIVSIDGVTTDIANKVLDMRSEDFDAVVAEVNGIKADTSFEEKKTA